MYYLSNALQALGHCLTHTELKLKQESYLRKFWVFAEQLKQAEVQWQVRGGEVCILTAVKHTG